MKKINLLAIVIVFSILMASLAMAALTVTLNDPQDSGTAGKNVTVTVTNSVHNFTCAIYAKSASTGNSTWTLILAGGARNKTATIWYNTTTFPSAKVEDSNDYIFNASCWNNTAKENAKASDLSTSVRVENTIPTTPNSCTPTSGTTDTDGDVLLNCSVSAGRTTACYLYFIEGNPGLSTYNMTHFGSTCYYSLTSVPEQIYKWNVKATDSTNTSAASTTSTIEINIPTSTQKKGLYEYLAKEGVLKKKAGGTYSIVEGINGKIGGVPIWGIGGFLIVVVILVIIYRKKR